MAGINKEFLYTLIIFSIITMNTFIKDGTLNANGMRDNQKKLNVIKFFYNNSLLFRFSISTRNTL